MRNKIFSFILILLLFLSITVPTVSAVGLVGGEKACCGSTTQIFTLGIPVKITSGVHSGSYGIIACGHAVEADSVIYHPELGSGNRIGTVIKKYSDGIDAALIKLDPEITCKGSILGRGFMGLGHIDIHSCGPFDQNKAFRYSGAISGTIENLTYNHTLTWPVSPDDDKSYSIRNVLVIDGDSLKGDSGAPVFQNYGLFDWNNKMVGLLSGSDELVHQVYVQQIQPVLDQLNVDGYSVTVLMGGQN